MADTLNVTLTKLKEERYSLDIAIKGKKQRIRIIESTNMKKEKQKEIDSMIKRLDVLDQKISHLENEIAAQTVVADQETTEVLEVTIDTKED